MSKNEDPLKRFAQLEKDVKELKEINEAANIKQKMRAEKRRLDTKEDKLERRRELDLQERLAKIPKDMVCPNCHVHESNPASWQMASKNMPG